jgi:hypothetical protein
LVRYPFAPCSRGTGDRLDVAIANIATGHATQLRISIESWRGSHKFELRQATATIPGIYLPTPKGIRIDIAKIGELIDALQAVEAEARQRRMLR